MANVNWIHDMDALLFIRPIVVRSVFLRVSIYSLKRRKAVIRKLYVDDFPF